jgi:hypothetical protein
MGIWLLTPLLLCVQKTVISQALLQASTLVRRD